MISYTESDEEWGQLKCKRLWWYLPMFITLVTQTKVVAR